MPWFLLIELNFCDGIIKTNYELLVKRGQIQLIFGIQHSNDIQAVSMNNYKLHESQHLCAPAQLQLSVHLKIKDLKWNE